MTWKGTLLVACLPILLLLVCAGGGLFFLAALLGESRSTSAERYYWPSGALKSEGQLVHWFADPYFFGHWVYYYESGAKWKEGEWGTGDSTGRHGVWTYYYENGAVLGRGAFRGDGRAGPWTWWYENGQVSSEGSFSPMRLEGRRYLGGYPVGAWRHFYPSGVLAAEGTYEEPANPPGEQYSYGFHAVRKSELDDHADDWTPDDLPTLRGGLASGPWKFWLPDGSPDNERSGFYQDGRWVRESTSDEAARGPEEEASHEDR